MATAKRRKRMEIIKRTVMTVVKNSEDSGSATLVLGSATTIVEITGVAGAAGAADIDYIQAVL